MIEFILTIISTIFPNFYLSGSPTFQKPLTPGEEEYWLKRHLEGDKEAKDVLIERNLRLVAHIVKKYNAKEQDIDDLISIGTIGLIKAISSFNKEKSIRLATYASKCIENEILMYMRSEKKKSREVSLNDPIGFDKDGNEISLIDVLENDEVSIVDAVATKIQIVKLYGKMKDTLTNREREIIELRYGIYSGKEVTQREIAKMYKISRSYVSRIEKKALDKLFNAMNG
ncbi:MAG: sigK [Clostridiales bacterium]|nr:sigK [Clostridiales bacterium]